MGMSNQFGFEVSAWSLSPGVSLALGGMLVVVIIMAATAIFLICYYWAALARKAMSSSPPPPSPHTPAEFTAAAEYKIFVKLGPPQTCPPSTVVLMPGEDMPTFVAMPCRACLMDTRMQDKKEHTKEGNSTMEDAEVKVEVCT